MSTTRHADLMIAARLVAIALVALSIGPLLAAIGLTVRVLSDEAPRTIWWATPWAASQAVAPALMLFVCLFLCRRTRRIASIFCEGASR